MERERITVPALIYIAAHYATDEDIDTYINRHGIAGFAAVLTYVVSKEYGEVTHRMMTEDLDISPLAAEIILQALQPVVYEHFDVDELGHRSGDSPNAVGVGVSIRFNGIKSNVLNTQHIFSTAVRSYSQRGECAV